MGIRPWEHTFLTVVEIDVAITQCELALARSQGGAPTGGGDE